MQPSFANQREHQVAGRESIPNDVATGDPLTSIGRARVNVTLGTQAAGTDRCLGGTAIVPCADRPAQTWILEPEGALVRIHNESSGMNKCLDVVNDGINNKLAMVACGDYTGQKWTFEAAGSAERFMKVRNEFTGPDRCFAAPDVNGRSELRMVKCVGAAPQRWQVAPR